MTSAPVRFCPHPPIDIPACPRCRRRFRAEARRGEDLGLISSTEHRAARDAELRARLRDALRMYSVDDLAEEREYLRNERYIDDYQRMRLRVIDEILEDER